MTIKVNPTTRKLLRMWQDSTDQVKNIRHTLVNAIVKDIDGQTGNTKMNKKVKSKPDPAKKSVEVLILYQDRPGGGPCLTINNQRVNWPKPKDEATVKYAFSLRLADLCTAIPGLTYNPPKDEDDDGHEEN